MLIKYQLRRFQLQEWLLLPSRFRHRFSSICVSSPHTRVRTIDTRLTQFSSGVNAASEISPPTQASPAPGSSICTNTIACPQQDGCAYTTYGQVFFARCTIDLYGGDIPGGAAPASGTKDCADRCATTPGCMAASWKIPTRICYLKSTLNEGVYSPLVNSKSLFRHELSTVLTMFRCLPGFVIQHGRKRYQWRGRIIIWEWFAYSRMDAKQAVRSRESACKRCLSAARRPR